MALPRTPALLREKARAHRDAAEGISDDDVAGELVAEAANLETEANLLEHLEETIGPPKPPAKL
jgi:hypothetical protein